MTTLSLDLLIFASCSIADCAFCVALRGKSLSQQVFGGIFDAQHFCLSGQITCTKRKNKNVFITLLVHLLQIWREQAERAFFSARPWRF